MTNTVHSPHPDVHEAGLADGCPACAEISENPTAHLDDEMLGQLATLATATDRLARGRSDAELIASTNVLNTLERVGRLAEAAPHVVAWYLREKWRLDVQLDNPLQRQARTAILGDDSTHPVDTDVEARVHRVLDLAGPVAQMLESGTSPARIHELVDVAVSEYQDPTELEETREWLTGDPACECGHRLSEHREEDGPGHAGCRAQVVVEGADAEKGEAVYVECDCAGFVSRDLGQSRTATLTDVEGGAAAE